MGAGGEIGMVAMCTWNKLAKCCRHGGTLWLNLRSDWHLQIPNTQNKTNTKGERERERENLHESFTLDWKSLAMEDKG